MAYGSGAGWAGDDQSAQSATVNWSTETATSEPESRQSASAEFSIQEHCTASEAAEAMATAWNAAHPNQQVTQQGRKVRWPAGTDVTNMSFTVNGGPPQEVPGLNGAVAVVGGLTVKNFL